MAVAVAVAVLQDKLKMVVNLGYMDKVVAVAVVLEYQQVQVVKNLLPILETMRMEMMDLQEGPIFAGGGGAAGGDIGHGKEGGYIGGGAGGQGADW